MITNPVQNLTILSRRPIYLPAPLLETYQEQLGREAKIPPPSQDAMLSVWPNGKRRRLRYFAAIQQLNTAYLCAFCTTFFWEFRRQAQSPRPVTDGARNATNAALELSSVMGNFFTDEDARAAGFDCCVEPLPSGGQWGKHVYSSETPGGRHTTTNEALGQVQMLRRDRLDLGQRDDVYMQISRDYQFLIKTQIHAGRANHGLPIVLLCQDSE